MGACEKHARRLALSVLSRSSAADLNFRASLVAPAQASPATLMTGSRYLWILFSFSSVVERLRHSMVYLHEGADEARLRPREPRGRV